MLHFVKTFVSQTRRALPIVMEGESKLVRKRKLGNSGKDVMIIDAHGAKQRKTTEKTKTVKTQEQERSNGLHSKSVLVVDKKSCLLFMDHNQTVAIQGKALLFAIKGSVDILGYEVKQDSQTYKLFSPSSSSLLTMRECNKETNNTLSSSRLSEILSSQSAKLKKIALARTHKAASVLLMDGLQSLETDFITQYKEYDDILTKQYKEEDLKSSEKQIHETTSSYGFTLFDVDDRYLTYKQPHEWNDIIDNIKGHKNPAILICGGKGVGKSTFARTVINNLLNSCSEVCYLECDVGQTELTPPTVLSLSLVSTPLLGPPFTHLQWPTRAYFYGDVSPKDNPDLYIKSISSLYKYYQDMLSDRPLVINTQGWVKGFGVPLLMDVIRIASPTHIVQINSSQATKNLTTITREFLDLSPGWVGNTDSCKPKQKIGDLVDKLRQDSEPKDVDVADLVTGNDSKTSYPTIYQMDACTEDETKTSSSLRPADFRTMNILAYFSPLLQQSPVKNLSLLHCSPYRVPWSQVVVHVNHTMVTRSQLLVSLNASIVGLAISPSSILEENNNVSEGLPKFIKETPITECVGLGIVRNIDPINRLFYILTPVPLNQLQRVNTLLKGNLEIPAPLLLKDGHQGCPYVSSEFSYDIKGAGPRKVRYNLQRKKFNSPGRPDLQ